MITLVENKGIPRKLLLMMAAMAGFTVANCYYNQPLLEMIRLEFGINQVEANLITVVTQVGYALGLFFIIPLGDLYSRRYIIMANMVVTIIMALVIAFAPNVLTVWSASLFLGACSVTPQLFIPIAGQYSRPENKSRNMGYILSGLLTGILASRVISGFVGEWLGWRAMFLIAALLMVICLGINMVTMPVMKKNFDGTWKQLMASVLHIFKTHRRIRLYSIRAAFGMGSMLAVWSCLSFHLADAPFHAGSDMVGLLGACGIVGAAAASGLGSLIPKYGIRKFNIVGTLSQVIGWCVAWIWGDTYLGLIAVIILVDIGLQCQQLSNQSGCLQEVPRASNRANTIFMTCYFIGGSLGTFCAGLGWDTFGWTGVCAVGALFALTSLAITLCAHD